MGQRSLPTSTYLNTRVLLGPTPGTNTRLETWTYSGTPLAYAVVRVTELPNCWNEMQVGVPLKANADIAGLGVRDCIAQKEACQC